MLRGRGSSLLSHYSKPTFFASLHQLSPPPSYSPLNNNGCFLYRNTLLLPHGISILSRADYIRSVCLLSLNDLRDSPGLRKKKHRVGRGIGSGRGGTCGRGTKGQKARSSIPRLYEGGQSPLRLRVPKRKVKRPQFVYECISLGRIATLINAGKINSDELITMKTLWEAGAISKNTKDGVRLFGNGGEKIKWPIHLEVTRVSPTASLRVKEMGGSVRRVYYNKLGMRALLKPWSFAKKGRPIPRAARPKHNLWKEADSVGRLPAPTKPLPVVPPEEKPSIPPPPVYPDIPERLHGFITYDYRLKPPRVGVNPFPGRMPGAKKRSKMEKIKPKKRKKQGL